MELPLHPDHSLGPDKRHRVVVGPVGDLTESVADHDIMLSGEVAHQRVDAAALGLLGELDRLRITIMRGHRQLREKDHRRPGLGRPPR